MGLESTPISDRRIYAQDTQPADTRDGVLWVDTTTQERQLSVYSEATGQWEPVKTDVPVMVTQEAVSFGESNVTVSHDGTQISGGAVELLTDSSTYPDESANDTGTDYSYFVGVIINPNEPVHKVECTTFESMDTRVDEARLRRHDDGTLLDTAALSGGGQETFTLTADLEPGTDYRVHVGNSSGSHDYRRDTGPSYPYTSAYGDVTHGSVSYNAPNISTNNKWNIASVTFHHKSLSGTSTVQFDSIPADLSAWDIATWQEAANDGAITTDIETNDGSGWTVYQTDAIPPYDISDLTADTDVRVTATLSRNAMADASPQLPYVARRGER